MNFITKNPNQEFGIGIEAEGFIVDHHGKPMHHIENVPSTIFIRDLIRTHRHAIEQAISFEESSIMLEIKNTQVFDTFPEAKEEIVTTRGIINNLLVGTGAEIAFIPVISACPVTEFHMADTDPNSECFDRIHNIWGGIDKNLDLLLKTNTASLQFNTSLPFREILGNERRLSFMRHLYNEISWQFPHFRDMNEGLRNSDGKWRIEIAMELLMALKKHAFIHSGFNKMSMLFPPQFTSIDHMLKWKMAHSDVHSPDDIDDKEEHPFTIKVKSNNFWAVECRAFDSCEPHEDSWETKFALFERKIQEAIESFRG